ncbi:MAG: M56 family metallopeptidase [Bacteroidota bacterium]
MRILDHIPDPLVNALAWSLLHSLWQIAAIALLWRISLWFARKAPAMVKQNLSIFAMLATPVIFLITFFRQYNLYSNVERIAAIEYDMAAATQTAQMPDLYLLRQDAGWLSGYIETWAPYVFWLYWTGLVLFALSFMISWGKLYLLRTRNTHDVPESWHPVIASARITVKVGDKIKILLSSGVSVPLVAGFFKPVVLFPLGIASSLTMEEVEEILLHEFCHIRFRDHYINALQYIIEILFFYHPFIWWISGTLRQQREARVDEWVVSHTGNPLHYARTLITLEERRNANPQPALAATSSSNTLFTRIKNVMHMKTRKFNPGQKIAAILVIAGATLSLAWLSPTAYMAFTYNTIGEPAVYDETAVQTNETSFRDTVPDPAPPQQPKSIVLDNGQSIEWGELSEEDRQEIEKALEEARTALTLAREEVIRELNSEEFRKEMEQAKAEIRQAFQKMHQEVDSEEFKAEMRKAREEMKKAMESVNAEMNSEEFRAEMQMAREEMKKAMAEMEELWSDEEFRKEMEEVSQELQKTFSEMEKIEWEKIANNLDNALQEAGKSMETLGPTLNEVFENFEELLKEMENNTQEEKTP